MIEIMKKKSDRKEKYPVLVVDKSVSKSRQRDNWDPCE